MMTGCFGSVAACQQFITWAAGFGQKRPIGVCAASWKSFGVGAGCLLRYWKRMWGASH
jgi:hypothetical protein